MAAPRSTKRKKSGAGPSPPRPPAPPLAARRRRLPARLEALLARVPFLARRRAVQLSRREILAGVPFRNPLIEWEVRAVENPGGEATDEVVLRVPRRQDPFFRLLNRLFEGPSHKQVILDELGSDVWRMCDGRTSMETLIQALASRHKLERREVEVSLTTYLKTLARRGFIGLRIEGESPEAE